MARVVLVRHGEAGAGWGDDPDPALSDRGRRQAEAVAAELAPLGPLDLLTSPLRRCRETAAPLAARWGVEPRVVPAVAEIPSPPGVGLAARAGWLQSLRSRRWADAPPATRRWAAELVAAVAELGADAVVVTHHVAINVVVGAALGDDRVFIASPANCSLTVVEVGGGRLRLVELGAQGATRIG